MQNRSRQHICWFGVPLQDTTNTRHFRGEIYGVHRSLWLEVCLEIGQEIRCLCRNRSANVRYLLNTYNVLKTNVTLYYKLTYINILISFFIYSLSGDDTNPKGSLVSSSDKEEPQIIHNMNIIDYAISAYTMLNVASYICGS